MPRPPRAAARRDQGATTAASSLLARSPDAGGDRGALETSRRGVFAIGDVRSGSVKRVAAAVGEGAQVVAALHDVQRTSPTMLIQG
jgi:thioredoxin reductase (NADPH)